MPPSAIVVIPARLSSTRLPRKMLLAETGRTPGASTLEEMDGFWNEARAADKKAAPKGA